MEKNKALERRSYEFEIRAESNDEKEKILTGRPIVYNQKTDLGYFDEVIEQGALDGANLTDVRFLVNHNREMIPLARSRRNNGNSTMKLSIDFEGLNIDFIKLDTENNATARELFSAVERRDIDGMSFCFSIDDEEWENLESEHPTRHIKKIGNVVEVSAVTFPAYEATEIYARNKEALENARCALEKAQEEARAKSVDTDTETNELQLLKEKINLF